MNKETEFAGSFYPADTEELNSLLNSYKTQGNVIYKSKAVIVPHAGYIYSGHCAMSAFQQLEPAETFFIIAPSHHKDFNNIAMPKYTFFETPLGSIEVNNKLIREIAEKYPASIDDEPFINEHSVEVQLPFLQNVFFPQKQNAMEFIKNLKKLGQKLRIVPILVGRCDYNLISDIISEYWENSSFIISSDLSHFYTQEQCRQIDTYTASLIETGKTELFEPMQACGLIGIKGLVDFAKKNNYTMIRKEMYNSGDISQDKDRVVGYGSWFLYEGSKNEYIKDNYSKYILSIAKNSIITSLENTQIPLNNIPPVMTELGASFVTLKKQGQLRGCIGSIYPTRPLVIDILDNARNAAFQDSRFEPVTEDEIKDIDISISLLSDIERIDFKDERDLMSKIYPYGIIISDRGHRAVYLPVVWEQLPDREIFFKSLKEKAGLNPEYFSKTIEVYKFTPISVNAETTAFS